VINPVAGDHESSQEEPLWLSMLPTNVPQIWMPQAKFNHAPHRAMSCQECHPVSVNTTADLQQVSWRDDDRVLLPQRSLCVKCHAPQSEITSAGARFDCVECHNYHNLDHPLAGLGAAARGVAKEQDRTLLELLRDQPPKSESSLPVHP